MYLKKQYLQKRNNSWTKNNRWTKGGQNHQLPTEYPLKIPILSGKKNHCLYMAS